ncbi:MAG: 4Fe-4S dicluster domain-containing protein [Candidatus Tectomicrobia bacterium]|uniref:4Fe-4S dicluster domain-containing protein n=1 Tax=Tectimicrobiota bacterium TaxID=2528274 RepID=A0A933GL81_UNCTE|nr:4Fe-4S dicluster domain-containing protein [Candidatus Tectomicrobia bacterium]
MMDVMLSDVMTEVDTIGAIEKECGENVNLCFQCHKCSSGCPLGFAMDTPPSMIMQGLRFSQEDMVLNSNTIWLCASCKTCTTRCPQAIDVAKVMDAARKIALKKGMRPKIPEISLFYEKLQKSIAKHGRVYELGLVFTYNMALGDLFRDSEMGRKMFLKRKISLWPKNSKNRSKVQKILANIQKMEGRI